MSQSGYNLNDLVREAQSRWLKPAEVLFILQNHENQMITNQPPQKPGSGSLFLFNKRVLRFFRKDGHSWRRKRDGRTVGEAHERLKVGNVEALNCYYAHGEQNPNFQRRSYWMLNPAYEHIVLVHYRDISEARNNAGTISQFSPISSSTFSQSPISGNTQQLGSSPLLGESYEQIHNLSSPGSVEFSSSVVIKSNGMNYSQDIERTEEVTSSSSHDISQALRRLEEQLSLNDDRLEEIGNCYTQNENSHDSEKSTQGQTPSVPGQGYEIEHQQQSLGHEGWTEMLDGCNSSEDVLAQVRHVDKFDRNVRMNNHYEHSSSACVGVLLDEWTKELVAEQDGYTWLDYGGTNAQDVSLPVAKEVQNLAYPAYSAAVKTYMTNPDNYTTLFDHNQIGISLEEDLGLTIAQKQKFTIQEISPEWAYASETTKVFIIGSFLCDPLDAAWTCMFGDIEVPVQIIQEGVICCHAPHHSPGNVTICVTSGNRESCSEVREFEYRVKPTVCSHCSQPQREASRSPEEMLLLVRFVQLLLSNPSMQKGDTSESGVDLLGKSRADEDSWGQVIEALLAGTSTLSITTDWLLEELVKDKLQNWLSSKSQDDNMPCCSLSKKEQGVIHIISGLGFEWALHPFLKSGVNVNFRDINGWTALHWAARFGREKMVAALIAAGASAGAVTDPNSKDPTGKTAASVAATWGHKGLAGYLSEVALTSHLFSLTLEESELSKGSADVEAERTLINIPKTSPTTNEDQLSLKDSLAAARNAAQAAARIQSAFRAHSFRRRQQKEFDISAASSTSRDEYGILLSDIPELSAASKFAFRNSRDYNSAALSIQKKYRGWKGRKDFLAFRQKVVKIQAHVRGYQVRKNYRVCWAVGILEKVVLRWRRRGVGLRGFRLETDAIDESEDEDILRVFRKQKVDATIDEAVSRVLSMVESPGARQQYRRILEKYRQAKAELDGAEREISSTSYDVSSMENDDIYQFV
ncbi:unnamed protein product [Coffea canephora]|uniref:CG-1 domain-containing protein n=1 Tax=Coffea canephora TaxID=49390 RepID=A0A068UXT9_COFCA|nr:unnamed protein product [Coffea canephora]